MTDSRHYCASTVADGRVFVFGGFCACSGEFPRVGLPLSLDPQRSGESYDPNVGRWQYIDAIPTTRANFAAATVGDNIYVVGGSTGDGRFVLKSAHK